MTTRNIVWTTAALTLGLAVSLSAASSSPKIDAPAVPANLVVPEGHEVFLEGSAIGTQNYICMPAAGGGVAWQFLGPQATLFVSTRGGRVEQQITTHFLSINPVDGLARATWQHSLDSSRVWAAAIANSSDPIYVTPGAIPWLLLQTKGVEEGPSGGTVLAQTTYIQRVNTDGGAAPASGCTATTDISTRALVPYTTDYFFYREAR